MTGAMFSCDSQTNPLASLLTVTRDRRFVAFGGIAASELGNRGGAQFKGNDQRRRSADEFDHADEVRKQDHTDHRIK